MPARSTTEPLSFPSGPLQLEGVLHRPTGAGPVGGVVVCHPHPLRGGDMHNHVVVGICQALAGSGVAALRFNFRGVGGSEGSHDAGQGEREDVLAALSALAEQPGIDSDRLGLAGYSFGAGMAARVATDLRVRALALVSLPVGSGRDVHLPVSLFSKPVFLITGDSDPIAPPDELRRLLASLPGENELVVVPGVDHFWLHGLTEMTARLVLFFRKWLRPYAGPGEQV